MEPIVDSSLSKSSTENIKRVFRFSLRWAVALSLLIYIFRKVPFTTVYDAMYSAKGVFVGLGFLISLVVQSTIADRLRRLSDAQGIAISIRKAMEINLAALFYGLFLPGGNITGIAIRLKMLSGTERRFANAGIILLLDRTLATISLCATGIIFLLLDKTHASNHLIWPMILLSCALLYIIGLLSTQAPLPGSGIIIKILNWIARDKLDTLKAALQSTRNISRRTLFLALSLSFLAHCFGICVYYLLMKALGLDVRLITTAWIRSAIILAAMIPFSVSGLGFREGATYILLTRYGITADDSIAYSLLIFATTVLGPALIGGLCEIYRVLKSSNTHSN